MIPPAPTRQPQRVATHSAGMPQLGADGREVQTGVRPNRRPGHLQIQSLGVVALQPPCARSRVIYGATSMRSCLQLDILNH